MSTQITMSRSCGRIGVTAEDGPTSGALVTSLCEGSCAARAGLHVGATIVAVNGQPVYGHQGAIECIDSTESDLLSFTLAHSTRELRFDKGDGRIGVTCQNAAGGFGVEVIGLEPGSVADRQLLVGDTILSINGVVVGDHAHAITLIDAHDFLHVVVNANTRPIVFDRTASADGAQARVGVTVADRIDGGSGVVVIGLEVGGLASRLLELGDTILSVERQHVTNHADAIALIDSAPSRFSLVVGEPSSDLGVLLNAVQNSTSAATRRSPSRRWSNSPKADEEDAGGFSDILHGIKSEPRAPRFTRHACTNLSNSPQSGAHY